MADDGDFLVALFIPGDHVLHLLHPLPVLRNSFLHPLLA